MRDLEQRLRNVEMGLRARPVKVPLGGGSPHYVVTLFATAGSDVLLTVHETDYFGISIPSSWATASHPAFVPTLEPPTSDFPTALGRARLGNPSTGPWVWVGTRLRPGGVAPSFSDLNSYIPNWTTLISRQIVQMPIGAADGTEFAPVYLAYRI